jgi:hypothetical protein
MIYMSGRDNRFRPNIIIKLDIFKKKFKKYSIEEWKTALTFLLEYIIKYTLIPGKVETWNILLDMKDFGLYTPTQEMKDICIFVQKHYRCRLNRLYFLNMSTLATVLFQLVPTLLGSSSEKKLIIIRDTDDLFKSINRSQIEKRYGGEVGQVDSFFPPCEVSSEYFVSTDDPDKLISVDDIVIKKKYKNMRTDRASTMFKSYDSSLRTTSLIYHQPVRQAVNRVIKIEADRKNVGPVCCASNDDSKCIVM